VWLLWNDAPGVSWHAPRLRDLSPGTTRIYLTAAVSAEETRVIGIERKDILWA
jgi:hypothetical protein